MKKQWTHTHCHGSSKFIFYPTVSPLHVLFWHIQIFFKTVFLSWGGGSVVKVCTALLDDLCAVPSTHVRWSRSTCNSSSLGSDTLFWQRSIYYHMIKNQHFLKTRMSFWEQRTGLFLGFSISILYCFTYKSTKIVNLVAYYLDFSFLLFF